MRQKTLILGLVTLFFTQYSTADEGPKAWRIKDLAEVPAEKVELRDKRERLVRTVAVDEMVYLYAVMTGIEEVAEIHAEFFLVEGKDPNAFAGKGENGENMVGINSAMLDLVGKDVHAAAAIIGHELAHLKLNHGEESRKARKNNPNATFTAASTKYSRDNEREADYLGVIWAIEAGYDPNGAVRVHEELYRISKSRAGSFVGSHPSSIERITILKSLVRRLSR